MSYQLFVRNAKDDFIGCVAMMLAADLPCKFDGPDNNFNLIIKTYSKDPAILSGSVGKSAMMVPEKIYEKQLADFGKYLRDRNKAGVVQLNGRIIYVLPAVDSVLPSLPCVYCRDPAVATGLSSYNTTATTTNAAVSTTIAAGEKPAASAAAVAVAPSSSSTGCGTASSASASKPRVGGNKRGISSLLSQIDQSNTQFIAAAAALGNVHARPETMREKLNKSIRPQLDNFVAATAVFQLALEPMEKEDRMFVHDIVTDYPGLISGSVGEFDDRHVVVYKEGHEPPDFEPHFQNITQLTQFVKAAPKGPRKPHAASQQKEAVLSAADTIVPVLQVKRDRRTQEMILEDINKNKRQRGVGGHGQGEGGGKDESK